MINICIECKYHFYINDKVCPVDHWCRSPHLTYTNPVTGEVSLFEKRCNIIRQAPGLTLETPFETCGESGAWWEPAA